MKTILVLILLAKEIELLFLVSGVLFLVFAAIAVCQGFAGFGGNGRVGGNGCDGTDLVVRNNNFNLVPLKGSNNFNIIPYSS
jgi:hypothetical protein